MSNFEGIDTFYFRTLIGIQKCNIEPEARQGKQAATARDRLMLGQLNANWYNNYNVKAFLLILQNGYPLAFLL